MFSQFAKAIATLVMIVAAFVINALSNLVPLNGKSVGELSNTVFQGVLMTPANYAFAIWGVIYLGVFAFGIHQVLPQVRSQRKLDSLRSLMMWASGAQIAWIFIFLSRQFVLSLVAMVVIWIALCLGYLHMAKMRPFPRSQQWTIQVPWSIYFSWISVATIVNVAIALFSVGWTGGFLSPQMWTMALMIVAMGIGMVAVWIHGDLAFAGVFIWALVAIAIRHQEIPALFGTGIGTAIALGLVSVYCWGQPKLRQI